MEAADHLPSLDGSARARKEAFPESQLDLHGGFLRIGDRPKENVDKGRLEVSPV
ncbi:MAG: hypothetical protein H6729_00730 [Deltaproteobacteria bacterium]|nr:hypothetical protein [Deltaproteobacteria bacterium]